ncbi:MAG TPA: hypothetical protein QGF02_04615 [Candidatus Babeliales bacterium]|nr:hypothetical protein [Candidatus Babeliales bacterium]
MVRRIIFPLCAFMVLLYANSVHHPKNPQELKELKNITTERSYDFSGTTDCDYNETIDKVTVQVRRIPVRESKNVFGHNLIKRGTQPLQVFIYNNTPNTITWRPSYMDLPLESPKQISKKLSRSVPAWLAAVALPIYWLVSPYLALIVGPTMAYSISKSNKKKAKRIRFDSLNYDPLKIPPFARTSKFLFVDRTEFKRDFEFNLFNEDKKKLIHFNVEC